MLSFINYTHHRVSSAFKVKVLALRFLHADAQTRREREAAGGAESPLRAWWAVKQVRAPPSRTRTGRSDDLPDTCLTPGRSPAPGRGVGTRTPTPGVQWRHSLPGALSLPFSKVETSFLQVLQTPMCHFHFYPSRI